MVTAPKRAILLIVLFSVLLRSCPHALPVPSTGIATTSSVSTSDPIHLGKKTNSSVSISNDVQGHLSHQSTMKGCSLSALLHNRSHALHIRMQTETQQSILARPTRVRPRRRALAAEEDDDEEGEDDDDEGDDEVEEGSPTPSADGAMTTVTNVGVVKTVRAATEERGNVDGGHHDGQVIPGVPIPGGESDGTNVTHLTYMLTKMIKTYKIRSVVDMPCRNTLHWFPELLNKLDFEVAGFKYYCVDTHSKSHEDIAHLFGEEGSPEFIHIRPDESRVLPKVDLVFSWDGPQQWGVRATWAFFTGLREMRPKYVMVSNNPGAANSERIGLLNLRKQPFHFAQAMRVISHVFDPEKGKKQMLLYEMDGIRRGF